MKKMYLLAVLIAAAMPLASMAQDDDLYFNPKKEAKEQAEKRAAMQKAYELQRARRDSIYALYWSGSNRNVDEYNRGGRLFSHYEKVGTDSLGNDIIQFHVGKGLAPDSIYDDAYFAQKYADQDEDFARTRDMSRWDGYYDPWFYDYYGYGPYYWRSRMWGWRNPWRYGYYAGWYDPWFDPWYDPWYYGYAGWYGGPWYGWGGYYPWYWGGPAVAYVRPSNGYRSFSHSASGSNVNSSYRNNYPGQYNRFGRRESTNTNSNRNYNYNNNRSFNYSNFGNQSHGGSFGGSRGGGFSGGGGGSRSYGSGRR